MAAPPDKSRKSRPKKQHSRKIPVKPPESRNLPNTPTQKQIEDLIEESINRGKTVPLTDFVKVVKL